MIPNLPAAGVLIADAGENQEKMAEVLERASKQAEEAGAKISKEPFNGLTLHIVAAAQERGEKDEGKGQESPPVRRSSGRMPAASSSSAATSRSSRI